MKGIFIVILWLAANQACSQSLQDMQGQPFSLDSCAGKKILVMILPLLADTAVAGQLTRFQGRNAGNVKVIGLVNSTADSVRGVYQALMDIGIIISQGIAASDTTKDTRGSLLQYLSSLSRNRQQDPSAVGCKFFVSEDGRLYANGAGAMNLDGTLVNNIIHTNVPGGH